MVLSHEGKKAAKKIQKLESIKNMKIDNGKTNLTDKFKDYFYQPHQNDRTLVFESRFESGNLALASKVIFFANKNHLFWQKVSDEEYNLLLQNDTNTNKYSQWFFFQVSNTTKGMNVKFNILNYVLFL